MDSQTINFTEIVAEHRSNQSELEPLSFSSVEMTITTPLLLGPIREYSEPDRKAVFKVGSAQEPNGLASLI